MDPASTASGNDKRNNLNLANTSHNIKQ